MQNPRLLSVTLTAGSTPVQLSAILATADSGFSDAANQKGIQALNIQVPTGGTTTYVGNSDVSATNHGAELIAMGSVRYPIGSGFGLIDVTQIYLWSTNATQRLNVEVMFS